MFKSIHFIFIFISLTSFIIRIALSETKPEILKIKFFKIAPHISDTFLLISGVILIFQRNWLEGEFGWIVSKFIFLTLFIILGIISMRTRGYKRWFFFTGAITCYSCVFIIAVTKYELF